MSTTDLFKKHFGGKPSVNLNHPNMEKFFDELNTECVNEDKRNAKLIAAAPDLLEALLALKTANGSDDFNGWHEGFSDAIRKANNAIKKATE